MSFLLKYSYHIRFLFLIGICPLTISRQADKAQCSRLTFIYSLLLCSFSWYLSGKLNIDRSRANMLLAPNVVLIANFLQTSFSMFAYSATTLNHIITGQKHAKFLNKINEIDRQLFAKLKLTDSQIDGKYYFHRNAIKSIILIAIFTMDVICAETLMGKTIDYNLTTTLYYILYFMLVSMYLFMLHIQCCAELLHNRYRAIHKHFHGILAPVANSIFDGDKFVCIFSVLQKLSDLKEDFESTFGFTLLLMVALDFLLITKIIFIILYTILLSTESIEYSTELLVLTFCTYILWPLVKNTLLVTVIQQVAEEVCIFFNNNNLFKQYMKQLSIGDRN